jgi:deoxyribodipyrimidine photo-lyase
MTASSSLVWFHNDFRMADNPALRAAARRKNPLICLFVWNPDASGYAKPGAASRWWLHHSIQHLSTALKQAGNQLMIQVGHPVEVISEAVERFKVSHVFGNYACEPDAITAQQEIKNWLDEESYEGIFFHGNTLLDPAAVRTKSGKPYSVFTPFYHQVQSQLKRSSPLPAPQSLPPVPKDAGHSVPVESLKLLPAIDWAQGIRNTWHPGEAGARKMLQQFLRSAAKVYAIDRDRPDHVHTSRLSPYLHFGEISPRQVWHTVNRRKHSQASPQHRKSYDAYLRQLVWREFARYLLYHFPHTADEPLHGEFKHFTWQHDASSLRAWQKGLTGYPIVDAGMRELWHTGWMHNRVRMIAGSFLTKDLLQPWQHGAEWFWETLVDADLANNTLGWQWVAGCGADASPFFRIFNPITQGRKFDPDGKYVRHWVPELAQLPSAWIHAPWEAPQSALQEAQVELGKTYPNPLIDHASARARALAAYQKLTNFRRQQKKAPRRAS